MRQSHLIKISQVRKKANQYFNKIRGIRHCFGPDNVSLGWTDTTGIIAKVWPKSESSLAGEVVFTKKCIGGCMGDDYECELSNGQTVMVDAPAIVRASIWDVVIYQVKRKLQGLPLISIK